MMQGLALQDTAAQSTAPFSSFHVGTLFTNSRFLPGFFWVELEISGEAIMQCKIAEKAHILVEYIHYFIWE